MENNTNSRPYQLDTVSVPLGSDPLNSIAQQQQQQMVIEEESKVGSEVEELPMEEEVDTVMQNEREKRNLEQIFKVESVVERSRKSIAQKRISKKTIQGLSADEVEDGEE